MTDHDGWDKECINLCDAINSIPGLETYESCCGHGQTEFRIWFGVEDLTCLPILLYFCVPCHVGFRWWCKVKTDCAMSPVAFYVESECVGAKSYEQAEVIAAEIREYMAAAFEEDWTEDDENVGEPKI